MLAISALIVSCLGLISLFVVLAAPEPLTSMLLPASLICPTGLALGLVDLWRRPSKSAALACALGFLGSLCIPTIWLQVVQRCALTRCCSGPRLPHTACQGSTRCSAAAAAELVR